MSKPTLGTAAGREVEIDVDELVASRLLVQANSGGGKSWIVRRLLEQTHGKVPHLVLDVEGDFHTLRERFDYVLAGREGADCPAHTAAAGALARRFLELGVSAIVDISEMSNDASAPDNRYAFVARFLEALIDAPRSLWHPTLVVVDEAQKFCPESRDSKVASRGAVVDLLSRGRKRGFAAVLATQRLSELAKSAASECTNVMIGRTILDVDQDRAIRALGLAPREGRRALRELDPGTFHVFGPAFGVTGVELVKSGAVSTTHPRPGRKQVRVTPAPDKVKAVLAELASIPREAEKEAKDLAQAQAQVRELKRELRQAQSGQPKVAPADPRAAERAAAAATKAADARLAALAKKVAAEVEAALRPAEKALELFQKAALAMGAALERALLAAGVVTVKGGRVVRIAHGPVARVDQVLADGVDVTAPARCLPSPGSVDRTERPHANRQAVKQEGNHGDVSGSERRILDALAFLEATGLPGPYPREQVAAVASYGVRGGRFGNLLGALAGRELLQHGNGVVELTDAGRAIASAGGAPTTREEVQRRFFATASGSEQRVLKPILDAYPEALSREQVAAACEPPFEVGGGRFGNLVGRLHTMGAVEYPSRGLVRARAWLFLE